MWQSLYTEVPSALGSAGLGRGQAWEEGLSCPLPWLPEPHPYDGQFQNFLGRLPIKLSN